MNKTSFHNGTILGAWAERDGDKDRIVFEVKVDDGDVEIASAPYSGTWAKIGQQVLEEQGLTWPDGLQQLDSLVDSGCRIKIQFKDKDTGEGQFKNVYICTKKAGGGANKLSAEDLAESVRKLKLGDEDPPF